MVLTMSRNQLLRESRKKRIIVLENLDFLWDEPELNCLAELWKENKSLSEMSEHFNKRDAEEVLCALLHLARNGRIVAREWGLLYGL